MVFLSNYLVFKIVLAALGRVDYPVAGDLELKYDTANKIYLSGGSLDYVDDYTLYTTIGGETTTHVIPTTKNIVNGEETILTGSLTGTDRLFGIDSALDGNYLYVGGRGDNGVRYSRVDVFEKNNGTWSYLRNITGDNTEGPDNFGWKIGACENYLIVGAYTEDTGGNNTGAAYVFKRTGATWTQEEMLKAPSPAGGTGYGACDLAINGDYAFVGASTDGTGGEVFVYKRTGTSWNHHQTLVSSDISSSDGFGHGLDLSGNYLVVGAPGENSNHGALYIFKNIGGTWTQQQKLVSTVSGNMGRTARLSIDGDYIVTGGTSDDSDSLSNSGAVYIFKKDEGVETWTQQATLRAPTPIANGSFGNKTRINGSIIIVGQPNDGDNGANAGAVYIYQRSGTTWSFVKKFYSSDVATGDQFGSSVSISENDVFVSAMYDDSQGSDAGKGYIYPRKSTQNFYITDAGKYSVDATIAGLKYKTNELDITSLNIPAKVVQVATGGFVSLALTEDGFVYAWGQDTYGQMGQGTTDTNVNIPVKVKGVSGSGFLSNITKISCGGYHCMALSSDGTVYAWGMNDYGQLGDNSITERKTPIKVLYSGDAVSNISAGFIHSALTTTTGKVYCWGSNGNGQVGDNTSGTDRKIPTQVVGVGNSGTLEGIRDVTCGDSFTHAIKDSDGSVYGWGKQLYGMIGNGQNSGNATTPTSVILASDSSVVTGITQISGGGDFALMLKSDGTVYTCGYGSNGQLGDGGTSNNDTGLVQVLGVGGSGNLTDITQIAAAESTSLALKSDGTMYVWGNNADGQNGLGTVGGTNPSTPVAITLLTGVDTINAGGKGYMFIASKPDGSVFCWGRGDQGSIGDGTNTADQGTPTQVLAGAGPSVDGKFNLLTEPRLTFDGYNKLSLLHGLSSVSSKLFLGSNVYDIGTLTSDLTIETPGLYRGLVFDTSSNVAYFNKTTVGAIGTTMAGYEADTIIYGTVQSGASHGNSQGGFGNNTILNADGTRLLVTDPLNYPSGRGRAYIYHLESGSWVLKQTWDNPNNSGQRFSDGACMNEDGTRVFLMHSQSEKVYTYEYASGAWPTANTGTHTISPGTIGSLCLNLSCNKTGDVLLIVHGRSQTSKIYRRASATSWSQDSGGSFSSMGDGGCINGDGTRAFLGRESDSTIHMTEWNGSTWSSLTQIINETDTTFPAAMACDSAGDTLVVKAATLADIDKSGIYERDSGTGSWSRTQDINGSTEIYGTTQPSISYDGTMVLVGSHHYDTKRGRAYLWQKSGGSWSLTKTYENPDASPASNDYWGSGTGIARTSKGTFVIGFQSDDTAGTDYGSVHIYTNAIPDFISFDTYNKLSLSGLTNPTSKIHALPTGAESTTVYDIGSATNIYIESAGTYTAEMKGSSAFALDSNVATGDITPNLSLSETSIAKQFIYDENGYTDAMFSEGSETQSIRLSSDGLAMALGDGNYNSNNGRLYYYERSSISGTFTKTHTFDAVSSGLEFGASVDMNAAKTRIAISGTDADNSAANAGRVYIYDRANTSASWPSSPTATITPPASTIKRFGHTVNMSDDGLTMITSGDGIDSTANRSGVYVYEYASGSWSKTFQVTQGIARFGFKVAMNKTGTRFIAGGTNTAYYVYHKESGTWSSTVQLTGATGNHCGMSPDGNTVAVGILGYSSNLGRVAVYKYSGSSWGSVVNIDTTVGSGTYQIGNTPVFNNDGTLLVTGCAAYNSYMGCFEMWKYESGSWVFKKQFLNPTVKTGHGTDTGEFFGGYLSMDYAGTSVIVSNTGNDVAGADYGRVVLYGAGSPPSLTFDGYNKYTFTGADTGSTYKLKYESNTYDLGTISNVYIAHPGTYSAEIKGATNFGLSSNVTGTTVNSPPTYEYIGFGGMTDLNNGYTTTYNYLLKLTKADGTPLLYSDIETFTILMDNGNGTNLDFTHIFQDTKDAIAAAAGQTSTGWHGNGKVEVTALADGTALSDHATNTYIAFYFKLNKPTTIIDGASLTLHRSDKGQWKNAKAFGTNTNPSTFSSPHTPTDWTELTEVTTVDAPLGSYNGGSNPSEPWTSLGATQDFNASAPGRHLSLTFDTYNKLTFSGLEPGSTSNVTFDGNTYSIGTASNVYIENTGTYEAESKGTTTFALTSKAATIDTTVLEIAFHHGAFSASDYSGAYSTVEAAATAGRVYSDTSTTPAYTWGTLNSVDTSTTGQTGYTWTPTSAITADVLMVAGGGGGGGRDGGGGGAGGLIFNASQTLSGQKTIVVGDGGIGGIGHDGTTRPAESGVSGTNTSFTGFDTAVGGGGGAMQTVSSGGSGGGGGISSTTGGNGTSGQGNNGGSYIYPCAGGGGGAGGVGTNATTTKGGDGGVGLNYTSYFGTSYGDSGWFASGGGGGTRGMTVGSASAGGGGNGTLDGTGKAGDGDSHTGGGGGGGGWGGSSSLDIHGGDGGSGIVIIRSGPSATPPSLTHDGYKLVVKNITPTSTTLKYGSNTYEIGSATNIYVENTGDYSAEIGNATDFALTNTTVSGTIKTVEPALSGGYFFGHALTYDGKLYGWGENSNGELGVGDNTDKTVPTLCTGIPQGEVVSIWNKSKRSQNQWAKTRDGKIWVTGEGTQYNIPGQTSNQTSFIDVTSYFGDQSLTANNITHISGHGVRTVAALTETGNVWTWGTHNSSMWNLGQGTGASSSNTPKQITFGGVTDNITRFEIGNAHGVALDTDGDVWFWGQIWANGAGVDYPQTTLSDAQKSPHEIMTSNNIIGVSSTYFTIYAWQSDGTYYALGQDSAGQIGDGTATAGGHTSWQKVDYFSANNITINEIYGGAYHVFADTSDGYYCWGGGNHGNFGNGSTGNLASTNEMDERFEYKSV